MRKYNGKSNVVGPLIENYRDSKHISREELAKKLQLEWLNIDRTHILRIEKGTVILKDFELIIIGKLLNMDLNELKNIL